MKTTDKSTIYAPNKIGPKRSKTPEGFLLCEDVPVARTGEMLYAENEVPVDPDGTGIVRVARTPEEVFRAETLASAEGKPVTLGHPDEFVAPANFGSLGMGSMLNLRRGTGIEDDLMFADLLITHADAIRAVEEDGIEEVSLGYEADYDTVSPGRGVQRNITVNHVALVHRGRCGPRCAIGDQHMATPKKSAIARFLDAFKSNDEKEMEKCAQEAEDEAAAEEEEKSSKKMEDAITRALDAALKPIRDELAELKAKKKDDDEDDDSETTDTVINAETGEKLDDAGVKLYTGDAARDVASRAEILSPGFRLPTFDAKTTDSSRAVSLCKCQRKALDAAFATEAGKAAIEPFLDGQTIASLPHAQLRATFIGASEVMRQRNNGNGGQRSTPTQDAKDRASTVDAINKANREFWTKNGGARH